jgi:hypothetical protein
MLFHVNTVDCRQQSGQHNSRSIDLSLSKKLNSGFIVKIEGIATEYI